MSAFSPGGRHEGRRNRFRQGCFGRETGAASVFFRRFPCTPSARITRFPLKRRFSAGAFSWRSRASATNLTRRTAPRRTSSSSAQTARRSRCAGISPAGILVPRGPSRRAEGLPRPGPRGGAPSRSGAADRRLRRHGGPPRRADPRPLFLRAVRLRRGGR